MTPAAPAPVPSPPPASSGATGADARRTRSLSIGLVDLAVQLRKAPETIFDVVIVGSGYGASVAAQKLAGLTTIENGRMRPITVCVLERGAEYLPGMFPSAVGEMPTHVRTSMQGSGRVMGNREGLFDVRMGTDVSALVANGLGGGSLVNAGVLLEPDFLSFESGLPLHVTDALKKDHFLSKAKKMLLGTSPPTVTNTITDSPLYQSGGYPLKFHRMADLAKGGKESPCLDATAAEITVAMHAREPTQHSVNLNPCNGCGDCMTGCNVGAKASLDTNLLAQARQAGAQLVTGASVLSLFRVDRQARRQEKLRNPTDAGELWVIDVVHTSPALQLRESKAMKVRARRVVLAAGTLGTPEILLRSRSDRLSLSSMLGEKFSCNGDNIAAVHRLPEKAHSTDDEFNALEARKVGPTITNMIAVPRKGDRLGFWIQEFAVPAPLKPLFAEIVTTGHTLAGLQSADNSPHGEEKLDALDDCAVDNDAVENTLLVGLIGHDSADGSLRLPLPGVVDGREQHQEGTLQIVWPQARYGTQLREAHAELKKRCENTFEGATLIANPMWRLLPDGLEGLVSQPLGPVLTVHPLGGCVMGGDVTSGVVNEYGQVFNARGALDTDVFDGLVVLDGSIIAGSLGANPSLTIAALALRAVEHLKEKVWRFSDPDPGNVLADLQPRPIAAHPMPVETQSPQATKVAIVERLWGHVQLKTAAPQSESFLIELTLSYEPVKLHALMARWGERVVKVDPDLSHLRLYPSGHWNNQTRRFSSDVQRFWEDHERQPHLVCQAALSGTLRFLHREKSSGLRRTVRGFCAYLGNRGWRDLWQELCLGFKAWLKPAQPTTAWKPMPAKRGIFASIKAGWSVVVNGVKLASRAGEVRRFDYALTVGVGAPGAGSASSPELAALLAGLVITGEKRLTYSRRGNPWGQLTTLTLTEMALLAPASNRVLRLDAQYMVQKNLPLLQVVAQQDKVRMALDMTHFALFMARLMLTIHLWSFRKPDASPPRVALRLPGALEGLPPPEITELTVALNRKTQAPIIVRLTRYRKPLVAAEKSQPPLAMIHGYSVSGTTFAHPSLKLDAARYFCGKGRDVWVIDLRTSAGLPTALQPWAMEEVALVDIPAALLHIKNATGQQVDVIGHCIGAAMLGMALLTDARDIRNATVQLGFDTWITPAQLGTLTAFNGDGGEGKPHPTVRSVVLSQKGPLLRYTEENIFRAYLMRSLRRWLVPDGYQFQAKDNPGVVDQLLDRLLASQHYGDADFKIENPGWFWKTTPWTATRHRVDALFGRVFAARNLSNKTLGALDDFFGPVNIDTVSQTIHFVRFSCITNQRGRGEFVTLANLRKRWSGIPTLSIHGAGNGLVDVSTQSLLKANFEAAGIALRQKIYPELEHQDVWIGRSAETVFKDIETFLKTPQQMGPPVPVPVKAPCWRFELPWIGPRLVRGGGEVALYALSSPKFGAARLVLVPVRIAAVSSRFKRCGPLVLSNLGDSRAWITADLTRNWPEAHDPTQQGWLGVMVYGCDQTTLTEAGTAATNALARGGWLGTTEAALVKAIDLWLASSRLELSSCLVTVADVARQRHVSPLAFDFALGSCRYPAGLMDSKPAHAALQTLAGWPPWSPPNLDFVIFCGDQIYADATAGIMDPTRRDERYDLPYEAALRAEPMGRLLRAVPAYTLPDDHEIVDNWEPPHPSRRSALRLGKVQRRQALAAFWNYQRLSVWNYRRGSVLHGRTSFSFDHGCASFFMLDTRSQRHYRKPGETAGAGMFLTQEFDRLEAWLCSSPALVKFIVTPSAVLPRRLGALNRNTDHVARGDAWEGYPGNFEALLGMIARKKISNVVFLSGDEHLGCVAHADISIQYKGKTECARVVSIHASGLYAPFPFANARPHDFVDGTDTFSVGAVQCIATTKFAPPGSLFATLRVACDARAPRVSVEFWVNGERSDFPIVLTR